MPIRRLSWLSVAIALCGTAVYAQQSDEEELAQVFGDKSFVSIATGTRQPVNRAPAVATVITAKEIEALGAHDLDEVLAGVPGLHVAVSGGQYNPIYVFRGIYGEFNPHMLLLVNGVPFKNVFVGSRSQVWAGMPVTNIARIEIIRGPGSALYGADAFSGVINVITKTASEVSGTEVGARAGSFGTRDLWVQHGGNWGPFQAMAYARAGTTDGSRETISADRQSRLDIDNGTAASLAPGPVNKQYDAYDLRVDLGAAPWRLRFSHQERRKVGTGAGVAGALDPAGRNHSERTFVDLSWQQPEAFKHWEIGAQLNLTHLVDEQDLVLFPPGTRFLKDPPPPGAAGREYYYFPDGVIGRPYKYERQARFGVSAYYTGWTSHRVRVGTGIDYLDLYKIRETKNFRTAPNNPTPIPLPGLVDVSATTPFLVPRSRRVTYAYVQDEWHLAKDWNLTAGVRHDRYSDFGGTTNPRLALVWDADYNLTAKLLYGRAFRAPTFVDLYNQNNPVLLGNPRVQPELINTSEIVLAWQASQRLHLTGTLFQYEMKDIIRQVRGSDGTSVAQNTGRQTGEGVEAEIAWDATRELRLSGNVSHQRSIDKATNQDAGNAPRLTAYLRADWRFAPGWSANVEVSYVGERRRPASLTETRGPVPEYTLTNLAFRKEKILPGLDLTFSVHNLFNVDAREPAPVQIPNDYPLPRRGVSLSVQYKLM